MKLRLALATLLVTAAGLAVVATPASAVPGLQLVTGMSALDSASVKEALAACPSGKRVLGGGGYIYGGGRQVHFYRLQALGSSDQFAAGAVERGAYGANWRVYAYAICGSQPAGLEYVSYSTTSTSDPYRAATAECSAGKKLISMGARVLDGYEDGQVIIDDVMLSSTLETTTATAYEDENGYGGDWNLYSYGVCANPLPGLEFESATSPSNSSDKVIGVNCPAGKKVHGVGGNINGALGEAMYGGIYPSGALTGATVIAVEDSTLYNNNWTARVYAICAF